MRLINFGHRWYDARHGRFINRDPIGEKGGINLYAFLANNPQGGYEYLGLSWFSERLKGLGDLLSHRPDKFFKRNNKIFDSMFGQYADTVRSIGLAFIPVVGPYLAAAYGAYTGYQTGGVFGAVVGAIGGYMGGKALNGLNWQAAAVQVARRMAIGEAFSMAVRAIDRNIRGFGKWFGRAMGAYTIVSGWGEFRRAFSDASEGRSANVRLSDQASRVSTPELGGASTSWGEMEWEVDGVWYSESTWTGRYKPKNWFSPIVSFTVSGSGNSSALLGASGTFDVVFDLRPASVFDRKKRTWEGLFTPAGGAGTPGAKFAAGVTLYSSGLDSISSLKGFSNTLTLGAYHGIGGEYQVNFASKYVGHSFLIGVGEGGDVTYTYDYTFSMRDAFEYLDEQDAINLNLIINDKIARSE